MDNDLKITTPTPTHNSPSVEVIYQIPTGIQ